MLVARLTRRRVNPSDRQSGRSSGVEHNLAKVGVEGSNPFARSSFPAEIKDLCRPSGRRFCWHRVSIPPVYHRTTDNIFWGKFSPETELLRISAYPFERGHPATPRDSERGW